MSLPHRVYQGVRPSAARAVRYAFGSRILTRTELGSDAPARFSEFQYGMGERYVFERPRHIGELPSVIQEKLGPCTVPPPFVVEIQDATAIGPTALVAAGGHLLLESVLGGYERLIDASVRALLAGQLPVETRLQRPDNQYEAPVFSLVGPWATDYYHWLVDYLVQVFAIEAYRERTGRDPLVLIPSDPPTWLLESIPLAGIDPNRIVEWSGTRAHFSRLVIGAARRHTASTSDDYIHSPAAMARLGDRIRTAVEGERSNEQTHRLYVSRADAPDRRVRNEAELVDTLEEYSFERFVPGEHAFEEQVRRFANAEVILGPHGAGLTNLIFAPETTLVELFGEYRNACFFALARGMGHEYACVTCRPEGQDIVTDVDVVESLVVDLLGDGN